MNAAVRSRWQALVKPVVVAAVLIPCGYGFLNKFRELIILYRGEADGAFAITPITNYLLATTGFLCLLGWATCNGMFRDIESPKHAMLTNEDQLDHARSPEQ